ncbi:MAG: hypothetical protein HYX80_06660 [Chloroflexi bacterium]|nr:hypothetical protein [Chloroflexota bacterium]
MAAEKVSVSSPKYERLVPGDNLKECDKRRHTKKASPPLLSFTAYARIEARNLLPVCYPSPCYWLLLVEVSRSKVKNRRQAVGAYLRLKALVAVAS